MVLGFLCIAIVAGLLWKVPEWQVPAGITVPRERAQLENEFRRTAAQIALGLGLLGTLFVGWRRVRANERTVEVAQEGQITERFTRAIDQLGNEQSMAIRLGGIYALERIAKDSERDHWQVMEVLTAYVRENAPWKGKVDGNGVPFSDDSDDHQVTTDIQAILTVLGRRNPEYDPPGERLDLSNTDLRRANLSDANLQGASLTRSSLQGAGLERANIQLASLRYVNLQEASLTNTNFHGTYLTYANFQDAYCEGTNFQGADLGIANLRGAYFAWAGLQDASINGSDFQGTNLWGANFRGADLYHVNLRGAGLSEVDLTEVRNLTREQIDSAITDETTILPDYLKRE